MVPQSKDGCLLGDMPTDWSKGERASDQVTVLDISTTKLLSAYPSCRVTNFPILLIIAWYERESATLMSNCARSCLHRSSKENCLAWILRNNFIRV